MKNFIFWILILLSSCSTIHNFTGPPERTEYIKSSIIDDGYNDYRGVIHCHSWLSHDSNGKFEDIISSAKKVGLNFLIMTDHITESSIKEGLRGWHNGILFIVGAEISKGGGSILALNIDRYIKPDQDINKIIKDIKDQEGVSFISHIEKFKDWDLLNYYDGIEIYNIHADVKDENKLYLFLRALFLTPKPFFSSIIDYPYKNLKRWDSLTEYRKIVGIAGNDAHQNTKLFGRKVGTYEELFRIVTTHIKAKELSKESLMGAIKKGHVYISFDIYGNATGFKFIAENGNKKVIMGDDIKFNNDITIKIFTPLNGSIRLIKDGYLIKEMNGYTLTYEVKEKGVYRVEVYRGKNLLILSNPVYIN